MRTGKQTAEEIEAAELAEHQRRTHRAQGFSLMDDRDRGYTVLSNGIPFIWHVPKDNRQSGLGYLNVPDNHFVLEIKGEKHLFDAEEIRRVLRWA